MGCQRRIDLPHLVHRPCFLWRCKPARQYRTCAYSLQPVENTSQSELACAVCQATTAAELRASAYLRAVSFYTYPTDRSEYAARSHRRLKADQEWSALMDKVAGRDTQWRDLRVLCLIAMMPDSQVDDAMAQVQQELDPSAKLPAGTRGSQPQLVVGTLDINQGAVLPSEELVGGRPQEGARTRRAYLSNVCVAQSARRKGVGSALLKAAQQLAAQEGVEYLYVHVVHDNDAAIGLYRAAGFSVEAEESAATARGLNRPRRLLLCKLLTDADSN